MKALMIDIESLSLRPDAHVLQIGLAAMDLTTGEQPFEARDINIDDDQPGRHIDRETVAWWAVQDPAVQRQVLHAPRDCDANAAFAVVRSMVNHLRTVSAAPVTVWASPAMYDLPTLTSLWGGKKPWIYNEERCLMTLYKTLDPTKSFQPAASTQGHLASADALWQLQYLRNLWVRGQEIGVTVG